MTGVENKISNITSLVKKTDYNANINEVEKKLTDHNHDKYITSPEFNNEIYDPLNIMKNSDLNEKVDRYFFIIYKMSEKSTSYQRNSETVLNRAK